VPTSAGEAGRLVVSPSAARDGSRRDLTEIMVGFARALRHVGLLADTSRIQLMMSALDTLDVTRPSDAYWAGRLTMCADPDDLVVYDRAFVRYFADGVRTARGCHNVTATRLTAAAFEVRNAASAPVDHGSGARFSVRASRYELLRHKDIAALTNSERAELNQLIKLLAPRVSRLRSRRYRPAPTGPLDRTNSLRQMIRAGGEPNRLRHQRRRMAPRRLVLLIDISGSMAPYADALLRFGHAAVRASPCRTEVFTIGTRLTRLTGQLRGQDPDRALKDAGKAVPDWRGGTRLGDTLKAFSDSWGQRGVARGATVVLCSDGWERGDPSSLSGELIRLRRLANSLLWVNPHKGKSGFAPSTGGMVAALPHIDALVAGHTLAALEELVRVIGDA
jgi:uncharacterized protein